MIRSFFYTMLSFVFFPSLILSQINEVYDDFEGNSNIPLWEGDDCFVDPEFTNPFMDESNPSEKVLKYHDTGGSYANVRFQLDNNLNISINSTFSLKIYVPYDSITGLQNNQVSLKLQNGNQNSPWSTQCEIIKPIILNEWQTVTFDFKNDNFINFEPSSPVPTERSDFNRILIQINGENNPDKVLAYIDDFLLIKTEIEEPEFNKLVWSDEFDYNGAADPEKWFHQTQLPNGLSWFNDEVQHYTNRIENTYVEDGVLKIVAKKETFTDQGVTKEYTSARLNSKFAFTYGRIEIRAKMPFGVGTWPALWMLGKNITEPGAYWETQGFGTTPWPACGEIDIIEHWGDNQNYVASALHTPSSHGGTINKGGRYLPGVSEEFQIYSCVWTEDKIEFAVNGQIHYTYNPQDKNDATWPFYLDQYLIFNVAIQPSIDQNFTESALEIDYVRVYQEGDATNIENENKDFSTLVFPNPFINEINIQTEFFTNEEAFVKIYNSNGVLVNEDDVLLMNGRLQINQLGRLPIGIYIVKIIVGNRILTHKLIKN